MFNGIESQDFSTFEKFKVAVAYTVIKNLSFNFIDQNIEYTTLNKNSEMKVKYFINSILNQLPIKIINEINHIECEKMFNHLIANVAGSGKREQQVNVNSGAGLHFSGLTKLCYDCAHILKLHRNTSFWSKFAAGIAIPTFSPSPVLHFTEFALANMQNPLEPVLRAIDSFSFS